MIDRVRSADLTSEHFKDHYLEKSRPVIITSITEGWKASNDWVTESGEIDLDFLDQRFGSSVVRVSDTAR
jgi:hypothetical protein